MGDSRQFYLRILIEGIGIGIVAGLCVAYLLGTPVISLKDADVIVTGDNKSVKFVYENTGRSSAINLSMKYLYGVRKDKLENFVLKKLKMLKVLHVGDVVSYELEIPQLDSNKENIIILSCFTFDDTNKIRGFINKYVLRNKYEAYRLSQYSIKKGRIIAINAQEIQINQKKLLRMLKIKSTSD
jgi:hypothetical protein